MEIRNLLSFQKICELGNFSKAAHQLGYSQSTITIQIKQLETELNVRLFDRIGKTVQLTQEGRQFLPYANQIISTAHNAKEALKPTDSPSGTVRIGILESVCISYLPDILKSYHTLFPLVTTVIKIGTYNELAALLASNQIDLLWTYDLPIEADDWHKVYMHEEPIKIIASRTHPLAQKSAITLQELSAEPFILTEKTCSYRALFEKKFLDHGYQPNIFLEIGNTEIIKKFVCTGLALSVLPNFAISNELQAQAICTLPLPQFKLNMQCQIFVHKDKWITPAIREFIGLVNAQ